MKIKKKKEEYYFLHLIVGEKNVYKLKQINF